jgi:GTP cyclohydrolase I
MNAQTALSGLAESPTVVDLRRPADDRSVTPPASLETFPRHIAPGDWVRFEGYMAEIFGAMGLALDTAGTRATPERFLRALYDATTGYEGDPKLMTSFPAERRGDGAAAPSQIIEGPIAFHALCEHHALPFYGVAHVAYVADERIIGISKLTRLVRLFARRFTVQERLGEQVADTLAGLVGARGVAVHIEASHLCTRMRGVEEHSATVTTFWRGEFSRPELRQEFLAEVHASKLVR